MGEVRRKAGRPAGQGLAVVLGRCQASGAPIQAPQVDVLIAITFKVAGYLFFSVVGKVDSQVQKKSE